MKDWIKNRSGLAITGARSQALDLICSGLDAIDTRAVIRKNVILDGELLSIAGHDFNLKNFRHLYVIGLGKASGEAVDELEKILGRRISGSAVVDKKNGTHPKPSLRNVKASESVVKLAEKITGEDLALVVVSGGGSALFCWPESELEQSQKLYDLSLTSGWTIRELNTVRKHISGVKGGGLAKMLYPAAVVGLVFCDIPGDVYQDVASGPTYPDETTIDDARKLLEKHGSQTSFKLSETDKDRKYFEKVLNMPLVSNRYALSVMAEKAENLGLSARVIEEPVLTQTPDQVIEKMLEASPKSQVVLAGGEVKIELPSAEYQRAGTGGRNQYLTLSALKRIGSNRLFAAVASDGFDNGEAAGAIADAETLRKSRGLELDIDEYLAKMNAQAFFEKSGDLIFTGETGANIADLYLLITL